jgi:hypothetical protein
VNPGRFRLAAYTLLLGLLALLGFMGHAAGLTLSSNNDVVPALFKALFPGWFAGFAFAAIAIGALVHNRVSFRTHRAPGAGAPWGHSAQITVCGCCAVSKILDTIIHRATL